MRALFLADWTDVSFLHFRLSSSDRAQLQSRVPFELDTFDGDAYVSLVSFTQKRLRPTVGGRIAERLASPIATHEFLNLRTYVKHRGERGIFFVSEWIPNRLASYLGPVTYGLPYRLAEIDYQCDEGCVVNRVSTKRGAIQFEASIGQRRETSALDAFLVERYVAFTNRHGIARRFEIEHEPWALRSAHVDQIDDSLCGVGASPALAHHSDGLRDVRISTPTVAWASRPRARAERH